MSRVSNIFIYCVTSEEITLTLTYNKSLDFVFSLEMLKMMISVVLVLLLTLGMSHACLGPYPNGPSDWPCVPGTNCRSCSLADIHCSTCPPEAPNCVFCPPGVEYCRPCPPGEPYCSPCPPYETQCRRCPPRVTGCLHQAQGGSTVVRFWHQMSPTTSPLRRWTKPVTYLHLVRMFVEQYKRSCTPKLNCFPELSSAPKPKWFIVSSEPKFLIGMFATILIKTEK